MNAQELQKAVAEMRRRIHCDVAEGFRNEEDIRNGVLDMPADDYDPEELRSYADQVTREEMAAHFREQSDWPAQTDCDHLDAAFADLERAGIVARQNFSCCRNCGSAEIWDEIDATRGRGIDVRGYTCYHTQDTEAAADGRGLYLGYGATQKGEPAALEIAREIVATIQRHGLAVVWDGSWQTRIFVKLDWKRRRHQS